MIKIEGLTKVYYDSKNNKCIALDDINLNLPNKGLISVVGKSGSGKSTLFNIIMGLDIPSSGVYRLEGKNVLQNTKEEWNELRSSYFSYIFQDNHLFDNLTVFENLRLTLIINDLDEKNQEGIIDTILSKFDLLNQKFSNVVDLSGGEKQRVVIARGLLKECKVMLADEPTGSLDEANSIQVFNTLKEVSKDILVIVVTHDLDFATKYSDYIVKLSYGKIIENTIIKDSYDITEFPHENKSFNFSKYIQSSNLLFKKQYYRRFFSIFFLTFSLMIILYSVTLFTFDKNYFISQTIVDDNILNNYITSNDYDFNQTDSLKIFDVNQHTGILFNKVYQGNLAFEVRDFSNNLSQSIPIFQTIKIDDLEDNEIIITDYQAKILKNNGVIYFENLFDVIGQTLSLNAYTLTIAGVTDTSMITHYDYDYNIKLATEYDVLIANENTLVKLMISKGIRRNAINDFGNLFVTTEYNLVTKNSGTYIGNINSLDQNTIALDLGTLILLTGYNIENQEDLFTWSENMIGKSISITFQYEQLIFNQNYIIGAITFEDFKTIYFSNSLFEDIFSDYDFSLEDFNFTYAFKSTNKTAIKNLITYLNSIDKTIINHKTYDIEAATSFMEASKKLLDYLIWIIIPLTGILIFFMTNLSIRNNRKNTGILYSMGASQRKILNFYIFENIKILSISIIIGLSLSSLLQLLINNRFKDDLLISVDMININFVSILVMAVSSLLMIIFSILISTFFINKEDIISLLKDPKL